MNNPRMTNGNSLTKWFIFMNFLVFMNSFFGIAMVHEPFMDTCFSHDLVVLGKSK